MSAALFSTSNVSSNVSSVNNAQNNAHTANHNCNNDDSMNPLQHTAKLHAIMDELNDLIVGRRNHILMGIVALLARHNLLLIGPYGTAKSLLARALAERISGANYFEIAPLTDSTSPDQLWGPVDPDAFMKGVWKRNTQGSLVQAHIAFLDEFFAPESGVQRQLVAALNERIFAENGSVIPIPLMTAFAATNEVPDPEGPLGAIWDRFTVRVFVDRLNRRDFRKLLEIKAKPSSFQSTQKETISLDELSALQKLVPSVCIPSELLDTIEQLRAELFEMEIYPSERRMAESLRLVQAHAILNGRTQANASDLCVYAHTAWISPDQAGDVASLVAKLANPVALKLDELRQDLTSISEALRLQLQHGANRRVAANEAITKYVALQNLAKALAIQFPEAQREIDAFLQDLNTDMSRAFAI